MDWLVHSLKPPLETLSTWTSMQAGEEELNKFSLTASCDLKRGNLRRSSDNISFRPVAGSGRATGMARIGVSAVAFTDFRRAVKWNVLPDWPSLITQISPPIISTN